MDDLKEAPEGLQEHPAPELPPEEAAEEKRPSHLTPEGEAVTGGADKALQEMAKASRETPQEILAATRESMQGLMQTAQAALNKTKKAMFAITESIQKYWDEFGERITTAVDTITEFIGSDLYRSLGEVIPDAHRIFDIHTEDPEGPAETLGIFGIAEFIANLESTLPFIREEAAAYKERTGQELTAAELFRDTDPTTGAEIESIYARALRHSELPRHELLGGLPDKYVMPRDNITQSLTGRLDRHTGELEQIINKDFFDLPLIDSGKRTEVTAYTMLAGPEAMEGVDPRCLTVLYGTFSLMEAGREIFTDSDILCTVRQSTRNTPQTIGEVADIMTFWRSALINSDLTAVVQRVNSDAEKHRKKSRFTSEDGDPLVGYKINENVLMLEDAELTYGSGKVEHAYRVVYNKDGTPHQPKLLEFSKRMGQIVYADPAVMAIRKTKNGQLLPQGPNCYYNLTWQRTNIRDYLYLRIDALQNKTNNKKGWTNKISFDTLYTRMQIDKADKKRKGAARDWTINCLDFWKAIGLIANYSIEKHGREYRNVIIELPKPAFKK